MNGQDIPARVASAAGAIETLRRRAPRIHCLTNTVAQAFTANVLLACGATPSMTVASDEVLSFTDRADGVLINLGTLDEDRKKAMRLSAARCRETARPFVVDPVKCDISAQRRAFATELLPFRPAAIRMNADEASSLEASLEGEMPCRVVTGRTDRILCGETCLSVANGHPWLTQITAAGCAEGALIAALMPVAGDPVLAALAALLWFNIAAEEAAARTLEKAAGPGTFQPVLIDCLHAMDAARIMEKARVT
ncbi:MAG: hydroxyethylthiazole kinase [Nitratireductor sp.]|nr:hydroxyethylthiazole kinase [Nitratireductor sp.]